MANHSETIIESALLVSERVKASALLVFINAADDVPGLIHPPGPPAKLVLVTRGDDALAQAKQFTSNIVSIPSFDLSRMAQIRMASLIAFSQQMLRVGDTFVGVVGPIGRPVDTMVVLAVGDEYGLYQSADKPRVAEHVRRAVFQRVLMLLLELADQGREGQAVGATFVLGDWRKVRNHCQQNIINPFKGYVERERNVLDETMTETLKEFCTIDGAFILKGNGTIVSAGTTLRAAMPGQPLPPGLGSRHAAAAAISTCTKCVAMTLSQSTGTVRVWRRGAMIGEFEREARFPAPRAHLLVARHSIPGIDAL